MGSRLHQPVFIVDVGNHGERLHLNLPAHQAGQQQIAGGTKFLVLSVEYFNLRKDRLV